MDRTTLLMAEWVTVLLALGAAICLIILAVRRYRLFGLHRQADRRLLLADLVLIIGALEILFDAIADTLPDTHPAYPPIHVAALLCRGAFAAGAFTLVVTFPADERRERALRRDYRRLGGRHQ